MKHYTYTPIYTNKKNYNKSNNYSKILDNIILTDVMNQNSYLKTKDNYSIKNIFVNKKKNIDTIIDDAIDIIKAIDIINNYRKKDIVFEKGTKYNYAGIPVIFYDDEIQIGFNIYSYSDLYDKSFINSLAPEDKDDIIKISIKINI